MSLKHLLNDDTEETTADSMRYGYTDTGKAAYRSFESNDTSSTQDQSWDFLAGFQETLGDTDNYFDPFAYHMDDFVESGNNFDCGVDSTADSRSTSCSMNINNESQISKLDPDVRFERGLDESHHETLVCYGMVHKAAVKLTGDMMQIDRRLGDRLGKTHREFETFSLRHAKQQIDVDFSGAGEFGQLNKHLSQALENLLKIPELQFEAQTNVSAARKVIAKANKATDAVVRVNINIYGPKSFKETIGAELTTHKVWLQHPDTRFMRFPYDNPHVIEFQDMEQTHVDYQPSTVVEVNGGTLTVQLDLENSAEAFQQTVAHVYESLQRGKGDDLERIAGHERLRTPLLPHQERALDFMTRREEGSVPEKFRLWRPETREGEAWFVHSITKHATRLNVEEKGGGILADEMGMGKSLSILSLVLMTLHSAQEWVVSQTDAEDGREIKTVFSTATLVIVPSALLINGWFAEINKHVTSDQPLRIVKWHGPARQASHAELANADLVITTYNTLALEHKNGSEDNNGPSILHGIHWYRIVLDEAHIIRRQATGFYKSCFDLTAVSRWCLTGTPIQNRLEDIGTLFSFIRARPFHSLGTFRQYIAIPYEEGGDRREAACVRLIALIDSLCLRRLTKLLDLPGHQDRVVPVMLTQEEKKQYESTKSIMVRIIQQRGGVKDSDTNNFGMFQANLQLRIFCNHGTFQRLYSWNRRSPRDEREALLTRGGLQTTEMMCSGCKLPMPVTGSNRIYKMLIEDCGHVLCSECLEDGAPAGFGDTAGKRHCPLCVYTGTANRVLSQDTDISEVDDDEYFHTEGHSSKMEALMADVKRECCGMRKGIIFSCWTRTLNLIAIHLQRDGISFQRIDGDIALTQRQRILDDFDKDTTRHILIMTTGTGAYGLNLTAASRVFIVEPQWNPSIENQAVARLLRLGQVENVVVTRYVVQNSIEQDMLSQQEGKRKIAAIGLGK